MEKIRAMWESVLFALETGYVDENTYWLPVHDFVHAGPVGNADADDDDDAISTETTITVV